jgi:hypothetical protein
MARPSKLTPEEIDQLPLPSIDDDLSWFDNPAQFETTAKTKTRIIRSRLKHLTKLATSKEEAEEVFTICPKPGECLHAICNGTFDHFVLLPIFIELLGGQITSFYGSTWTMNRNNALDLLALYDNGAIGEINLLTGNYFKRREQAVYATVLEGLLERGQRFVSFANHTKIMLLQADENYLSIEGSANFTSNPRLENTTITNDRAVWEFHVGWMREILDDGKAG